MRRARRESCFREKTRSPPQPSPIESREPFPTHSSQGTVTMFTPPPLHSLCDLAAKCRLFLPWPPMRLAHLQHKGRRPAGTRPASTSPFPYVSHNGVWHPPCPQHPLLGSPHLLLLRSKSVTLKRKPLGTAQPAPHGVSAPLALTLSLMNGSYSHTEVFSQKYSPFPRGSIKCSIRS